MLLSPQLSKVLNKRCQIIINIKSVIRGSVVIVCCIGIGYLVYKSIYPKTNPYRPAVKRQARQAHRIKTKINPSLYPKSHYRIAGKIYTKHIYKSLSPGYIEDSPKKSYIPRAKKLVHQSAREYIDHASNRSEYATYISPASVFHADYNAPPYNDNYGGYGGGANYTAHLEVVGTTAVFVKKGSV